MRFGTWNVRSLYRGADKSLALPTPDVFYLTVRMFLFMLVLLYIYGI